MSSESRSSSHASERGKSAPQSASGSREGTYAGLEGHNTKVDVIEGKDMVKVGVKEEEDGDVAMGDDTSPTMSGLSNGEPTNGPSEEKVVVRKSTTPPVPVASSRSKVKSQPQLIGNLPRAEGDALKTFEELPGNHYQYGTLGRSREALESMTCDCQYDHGVDDPSDACGDGSDCINRLTQVECLPDDCRCRSYCKNQRFQRKEYAPIHIVLTEKKGYGLRTAEDLPKDQFIYEYVGDVVSQPSFLKRMRQYAEEGIRHFYFMMLQKDEYIDATKRGGIGRFANHSCNPNCYVAKWTVGNHVRMGIFASRNIKKDEELTFNYNVDRYGHEAQLCFCGEPNCIGYIGGKTQTDIAAMDDLYLDALGITEEVEQLGLKGSKKKKSKKLDEDYQPTLKPLVEKEVPKVVQAMRQTQSRKVLLKLLTRVKITEDQSALRQIMRLRGFSVMTNILEDYLKDLEICAVAMECMMTWPLIQRNKVEDSKVNVPVKECSESDDSALSSLAKKLLEHWETLEYAYRIPKRLKADGEEDIPDVSPIILYTESQDDRPSKRQRKSLSPEPKLAIKPMGHRAVRVTSATIPMPLPSLHAIEPTVRRHTREDVAAVIAAASAAAAAQTAAASAAAAAAEAEAVAQAEQAAELAKRKAAKASKPKPQSPEEKETNKEKRLLKLIGPIVVRVMSKYQSQMDHESFKRHAKELSQLIADKEKKSNSYKEGKLDVLSDEKTAKIKKFAKEYVAKMVRKLEKKRKHKDHDMADTPGSSSTPATHTTHNDMRGGSEDMLPTLSVDDVTDMADHRNGEEEDDVGQEFSPGDKDSGSQPNDSSPPDGSGPNSVADPRIRHRQDESGWDPSSLLSVPAERGLGISC